MLLKTHKMVLALAILSGASAAQAALIPDLLDEVLPDRKITGIFAEESNPGASPLVGEGTGILFQRVAVVKSNNGDVPLNGVIAFSTPREVGVGINRLNTVNIFQINGRNVTNPTLVNKVEGIWTFGQVGTQEVWFGEWNAEQASGPTGTKVPGTHNVFYIGNIRSANIVNSAIPLTYHIKSINNYSNGTPAPTSELTVNFTTAQVSSTGDISFTNGLLAKERTATRAAGGISAENVSVTSAGGTGGVMTGQLYTRAFENLVASPSMVAGIVTFSDRDKNTAFGGATFTPPPQTTP